MNSKKQEPSILPGIREALHPGLGNGAALETEKHAFLLRVPDPSKYLESSLGLEPENLQSLPASTIVPDTTEAAMGDQISGEHADVAENPDKTKVRLPVEDVDDHTRKPAKKPKKTVKSLQKEESNFPEHNTMERKTESTLSPFTLWLKGLSGSEYVHPYDDDFALRQEAPATGEGISETYADLLAAQGYKDQAIEMYKRLMEKYPEKSGFFAAKIEALS